MNEPQGISARFSAAFLSSTNQFGFSLATLLSWIAVCDNDVAESERHLIADIAGRGSRPIDPIVPLEAAQWATPEDLQLACEVVRHVARDKRRLILDMAIGVALADGTLRPTENHVLRFLADMLELGESGLDDAYREITGSSFSRPPDMSSADYWQESRQERRQESRSEREDAPRQPGKSDSRRVQALATLGLESGAAADEIVKAYRRLAKVHHPDRFETLGAEAVKAATQTFQRIQSAYEYLRT